MTEFAVMAETFEGNTMVLRRGFASSDLAEDHPVKLNLWKRVWVDEILPKPTLIDTPPPFPWSVLWMVGHAYLVDADGRKIASLLGSQKRREHIAEVLHGFTGVTQSIGTESAA